MEKIRNNKPKELTQEELFELMKELEGLEFPYVATTHVEHTTESQNKNLFSKFIAKHNAKNQAKTVLKGLQEVNQIKSGKKKEITFDKFLSNF